MLLCSGESMKSKIDNCIRTGLAFLVAVLLVLCSSPSFAQGTTGSLRGQILDPSGAGVPGAKVTVTNQNTGVSVTLQTTSAGTYEVPHLIPGPYNIGVEAEGFKSLL